MMNTRGVVYYNTGTSCGARLLVSLHSLRQHYSGPVTLLSEGAESHALCARIASALKAEMVEWDCGVPAGKHRAYLAKTRYHLGSPYDTTLALDSDTLVTGPVDALFELAETHTFCVAQISNWRTSSSVISRRIREWQALYPQEAASALTFGPAINCGVVAFTRDAALCRDWCATALPGREFFIPDEVCCQLMLPRYPHHILDGRWNRSCKHDDPALPDTRIIHYHGRKHCRPGLPYHGKLWTDMFEQVRSLNLAGLHEWLPAGDRMLRRHLQHRPHKAPPPRESPMTAHTPPADLKKAVAAAASIKLVLGAGKTRYPGWISTNRNELDVTQAQEWRRLLGARQADRLLAEHVWDRLTCDEMDTANQLAFEHLAPGGCLRIAVPDGWHPDPEYVTRVRPGGTGPAAAEHRQLLTHPQLAASLQAAGFQTVLIEYWDSEGSFHHRPWRSQDGPVKRSLLHDRRNRHGKAAYTSLMVDAIKPL